VNLAARLESGAKIWGARILVTDTTRRQCEQHGEGRVVFRALGRVQVVGRNQMVPVSEIMGLRESVAPVTFDCIEHFERGLARYLDRDWTAAAAEFEVSASLEPQQPDAGRTVTNPSLVYLALVAQHRISPPPANWNGCYVMSEK
jgi:adenylate cyclase